MDDPPDDLTDGLSDAERSSVVQWWASLSSLQRNALQHVLAAPECTLHVSTPDDSQSSSAVDLFADDWETNWADNWESDWREYLTEHSDVRLVTLPFLCYTLRYGR